MSQSCTGSSSATAAAHSPVPAHCAGSPRAHTAADPVSLHPHTAGTAGQLGLCELPGHRPVRTATGTSRWYIRNMCLPPQESF